MRKMRMGGFLFLAQRANPGTGDQLAAPSSAGPARPPAGVISRRIRKQSLSISHYYVAASDWWVAVSTKEGAEPFGKNQRLGKGACCDSNRRSLCRVTGCSCVTEDACCLNNCEPPGSTRSAAEPCPPPPPPRADPTSQDTNPLPPGNLPGLMERWPGLSCLFSSARVAPEYLLCIPRILTYLSFFYVSKFLYCFSITVVCISSPPLPLAPVIYHS